MSYYKNKLNLKEDIEEQREHQILKNSTEQIMRL